MLTSLANPRIQRARKLLKAHPQDAFFLIEGEHSVAEAQARGLVEDLFTTEPTLAGTLISEQLMRSLSDLASLPRQLAVVRKPLAPSVITGQRLLALDFVQDPGNVGTLIRTAVAFGFDGVIVRGANVYSPKVIRATQGALFHINLWPVVDLAPALANQYLIGATLSARAQDFSMIKTNLPTSLTLVLGNEGRGISPAILNMLNCEVIIPVQFESLNVASAGAILMQAFQLGS